MQSPNTGVGKKLCRSDLYPTNKDTTKRPKNFETFGRKIIINGTEWRWKFGRSMVVARSEYGAKITSPPEKIIGVTPDEFERGQWKKNFHGMVQPHMIANWIKSKT